MAEEDFGASRRAAKEAEKTAELLRWNSFFDTPEAQDLIARLLGSTPAQISGWIDTNVTDLASARAVLKRIVFLLVLLISKDKFS